MRARSVASNGLVSKKATSFVVVAVEVSGGGGGSFLIVSCLSVSLVVSEWSKVGVRNFILLTSREKEDDLDCLCLQKYPPI